jgi:hypothetical protein
LVELAFGEIPARDRESVEFHLARCGDCRAALAALRYVTPLIRSSEAPMLEEEFWRRQRQSVMRRIRSEPPTARASRSRRPWSPAVPGRRPWVAWAPVLAAATAVLGIVVLRPPLPWQQGSPAGVADLDQLDDGELLSVAELAGLSMSAGDRATDTGQDTVGHATLPDLSDDELDALAQLVGQRTR